MPDATTVAIDTIWTLSTGVLVFLMNAGFACLEAGFCRAKNTVNILTKNVVVVSIGMIAFWLVGFAVMYGNGTSLFGTSGWALSGADNSPAIGEAYSGDFRSLNSAGIPLFAKFFFQAAFACTAASIVSGAVAERVKLVAFILFSFVMVALIYPLAGHWIWGDGWLDQAGFYDAAGATVVHSVGGWSALSGVLILGPRIGKFVRDGSVKPISGHSMSLATLGTFILWIGWVGFNTGSPMRVDAMSIALVAINTNMAGAGGCATATLLSWTLHRKPDITMTLNGMLAGLVAITGACPIVSPSIALLIGAIAGVLVVAGVLGFDKLKIDDPVGALSVHLLNGIWGALSVGIFGAERGLLVGGGTASLLVQLQGIVSVGATTLLLSGTTWLALKATTGVRVDVDQEREGLDLGQHGMEAYPGFVPTQE